VYDRIVPRVPTNRYAKRPAFAYRLSSVTSCSTRTARADPASWTGSTGHSYQPGSRLSARDRALAERFGIEGVWVLSGELEFGGAGAEVLAAESPG
jgi:hypothetical protein